MNSTSTRLYGVPAPLFCESPTSWAQRVCQQYDLTYRRLFACIGQRAVSDIDLALQPESYVALARVCGMELSAFNLMRQVLGRCVWMRELRELLGFRGAALPSYRFCCLCWRADPMPYLRLEWRFERWRICPVHRIPMSERCPLCDEPLQMQRAVLGGADRVVPSLGHCYCCGCDMRMSDTPQPVDEAVELLNSRILTQRATVSAVAHGYFLMDGLGARALPIRKLPVWLRYGVLEGGVRSGSSGPMPVDPALPDGQPRLLTRTFLYELAGGSRRTSRRRRTRRASVGSAVLTRVRS